ncbi:MAG: hypothetical protein ACP5M0_14910 [Desulfomonilaceae bacterium]
MKTTGIVTPQGRETRLCDLFREKGVADLQTWELVWVNVVFNFPTAMWYVTELGLGQWSATHMRQLLHARCPHLSPRTITNAVLELVGLFQHTPIGGVLNQGAVDIAARPRMVTREGLQDPSLSALTHSFITLFHRQETDALSVDEPLPWPWIVFGCAKSRVIERTVMEYPRLLAIDAKNSVIRLNLQEASHVGIC